MNFFKNLIKTDEFYNYEYNELMDVLSDDNLQVYCEEEVFESVIRWVEFDPDNRKQYFELLMGKVRVEELRKEVMIDFLI